MRLPLIFLATCGVLGAGTIPQSLRLSLSFHASFDKALDADFARGERKIYNAPDYKQLSNAKPGLGDVDAAIEKGAGVAGSDALRFRSKNTRALFFRGDRHIALSGGTLSFWLKLDPQKDLAPGYTDPIQLTDKEYNNSAIWVDFTKDDVPRHFRLGVFGSLKVWNPADTPPPIGIRISCGDWWLSIAPHFRENIGRMWRSRGRVLMQVEPGRLHYS
ncbi:MAG: hypothetical protein JWO48_1444 [Bryobacterales bacterium]|nr:hypothetical protein [Bryobacterales bacterium]